MNHDVNTSERIHARLKGDVLAGTLADDGRLDFAELAGTYDVSTTPVREAAMRLLGEGLLELHPKGGVRPARLTEFRLRALLDLHAMVILGSVGGKNASSPNDAAWDETGNNAQRSRIVFHELALRRGNPELRELVDRLSDRLTPYRLGEDAVFTDVEHELVALRASAADPAMLRRLLRSYHRRRIAKAAKLVWEASALSSRASQPS